jgi:DNA polymerase III delta prime subunit
MDFQNLWAMRWRPETLKDILLSKEVREFFEVIEKSENPSIPHLMFYGPPGCGKTSLAFIVVKSILKADYLYINASDENGIETIRGKIKNYIETKSFDGKMKVVVLDEFDGMSSSGGAGSSAQQALRNILEEYADHVRFIFTCNYAQKVIEPIWSRVQAFYIQPDLKDFQRKCLEILKSEKIQVTPESRTSFFELVQDTYPDLRLCLNELQKSCVSGTFKMVETSDKNIKQIVIQYWQMVQSKRPYNEIRKYIIDNEKMFRGDYQILLKSLFEYVYDSGIASDLKGKIMLKISETMYYHVHVLDKEINYFAMTLKLLQII